MTEKLKDLMAEKGLKVYDIVGRLYIAGCPVTQQTVYNWLANKTVIQTRFVLPLCGILGCDVEDFLRSK